MLTEEFDDKEFYSHYWSEFEGEYEITDVTFITNQDDYGRSNYYLITSIGNIYLNV